ncbi:Hypothetical protein PHPALM_6285 [Phytophthora palmivora]|uniref:Uncharacterized protein n=1 Tax=Phytophthora palmivora TaxID=4796 RepID=A0A2P4YFK1_9STRA|nr:Hypothetical protein PHPALM_6285 [Phytophthora palmivora]
MENTRLLFSRRRELLFYSNDLKPCTWSYVKIDNPTALLSNAICLATKYEVILYIDGARVAKRVGRYYLLPCTLAHGASDNLLAEGNSDYPLS